MNIFRMMPFLLSLLAIFLIFGCANSDDDDSADSLTDDDAVDDDSYSDDDSDDDAADDDATDDDAILDTTPDDLLIRRGEQVGILFNSNNGSFDQPVWLDIEPVIGWAMTADFNQDDKQDILLSRDMFQVLLGNGDGTFDALPEQPAGDYYYNRRFGDLNGDGFVDFIGVNPFTRSFYIYLGNGDGTFQGCLTVDVDHEIKVFNLWDVDGDGFDDVLAVEGEKLIIFHSEGDGNLTKQSEYTVAPLYYGVGDLAVEDFNGDGKADVALAMDDLGMAIYLSNSDGTLQDPVYYPPPQNYTDRLNVGDLNLDQIPDIVAGGTANNVAVYLGLGDGAFADPSISFLTEYINSLEIGFFDEDSNPDIAVVYEGHSLPDEKGPPTYNPLVVLLGNGDGTLQSPKVLELEIGHALAANFDNQ